MYELVFPPIGDSRKLLIAILAGEPLFRVDSDDVTLQNHLLGEPLPTMLAFELPLSMVRFVLGQSVLLAEPEKQQMTLKTPMKSKVYFSSHIILLHKKTLYVLK